MMEPCGCVCSAQVHVQHPGLTHSVRCDTMRCDTAQDMAWHPLGHVLATASNDHFVKFWGRPRPGDTRAQYEYKGALAFVEVEVEMGIARVMLWVTKRIVGGVWVQARSGGSSVTRWHAHPQLLQQRHHHHYCQRLAVAVER